MSIYLQSPNSLTPDGGLVTAVQMCQSPTRSSAMSDTTATLDDSRLSGSAGAASVGSPVAKIRRDSESKHCYLCTHACSLSQLLAR